MSPIPSFGVPRLDDAFGRPASTHAPPPGTSHALLLFNDPGVDARPFLAQAAANALNAGQPVVYLTFDRPPRRVLEVLRDAGATTMVGLRILDAHSSLHGIPDPDHSLVDAENVADVITHLRQAAKDTPDAVLVIDSLNGLVLRCGVSRLAAAAHRLQQAWSGFHEVLATYTHWHEEIALRSLLDSFPDRIHLQGVQDRIITHEYFRIERVQGRVQEGAQAAPVLYRSDGGHVRAYIPKLLVTGPADAGKTTFIHSICDRAVSTERAGKTVAMDRGHLARHGVEVEVFGTPGQERFDPMMGPIMAQAVGVVLVVDSTQPQTFERAMTMLRRAWRNGLHAVIAANKQDLEGAMSPEAVAKHLSAPQEIAVLPCQAAVRASAMDVMDQLLHRILSPEVTA